MYESIVKGEYSLESAGARELQRAHQELQSLVSTSE